MVLCMYNDIIYTCFSCLIRRGNSSDVDRDDDTGSEADVSGADGAVAVALDASEDLVHQTSRHCTFGEIFPPTLGRPVTVLWASGHACVPPILYMCVCRHSETFHFGRNISL